MIYSAMAHDVLIRLERKGYYETKDKESFIIIFISAISNYDMVFFAISDYRCSYGTYSEWKFYSFLSDVYSIYVSGTCVVWILMSGRRTSGMPFRGQSQSCETGMEKQDKIYNLDTMDDCYSHYFRLGEKWNYR